MAQNRPLELKEYRQLEGTTTVEALAYEIAQVLELAARDARYDFQCAFEVRPATRPELNHLGSRVRWVDYRILLDEVGKRHEEAGVIPARTKPIHISSNGGR